VEYLNIKQRKKITVMKNNIVIPYSLRDTLLKLESLPRRKGVRMIFKRVDHVEIVPRNAEKTIDFYVNVLGFRIRGEMK